MENLPGETVRDKRKYLEDHGDGLRRLLLNEPYGDPAMSVNLVLPPSHPDASAGYIIMEAMGYPMYSGSNTICTATAILEKSHIRREEGEERVVLESPAGLAHVTARWNQGQVESITTQGQPAYVAARDCRVRVPGHGEVRYDLVWSGCFYAMIDAGSVGFSLVRDDIIDMAAFGNAFIKAARNEFREEHPEIGYEGPLAFIHFMGPVNRVADQGFESRSATYVHPGVICRSPTGTGTSARLALMAERGEITESQWLDTISPRENRFRGTLLGEAEIGTHCGVHSNITGRAWILAHSRIVVDLDDPLIESHDLENVLIP